jgi:hypothetical protein
MSTYDVGHDLDQARRRRRTYAAVMVSKSKFAGRWVVRCSLCRPDGEGSYAHVAEFGTEAGATEYSIRHRDGFHMGNA